MTVSKNELHYFSDFINTLEKFGIKLSKTRCIPKSGKDWQGNIYSNPYYIITPEEK